MMNRLKRLIEQATECAYDTIDIICEHADRANDIKQQIRDLTPNIFEHIYKIQAFGKQNPTTVHHWAAEIVACVRQFAKKKVKANKKYLPTQEIIKSMLSKYIDADEFGGIVGSCFKEYGWPEKDDAYYYDKVKTVLFNLVEYIRNTERPNLDDVVEIILEE